MKKIKKDTRDKFWKKLEEKIQQSGKKKDKKFVLSGPWKKFVKNQDGYKVYSVDENWVRNNLSVIFGHGGHGLAHEFIPMKEIWVARHHVKNCGCKNTSAGQKLSKNYFESTLAHEIEENKQMKKGVIYWEAHQAALQKEIEAGFLADPYLEV